MAITRKEKEDILSKLEKDLDNAKGLVFTEYRGVKVKDMTKIRRALRKENVSMVVAKVTLIKKALRKLGLDISKFAYNGPIAVAISKDDESVAARLIKKLSKENPSLVVDGGVVNNEIVTAQEIAILADLPTQDQLLGQLLSVLSGPARGLVTVLSGNNRKLVTVLKAIGEKKA